MTLGELQLVADAAGASGHLCSGALAPHLAHLHLLSLPIIAAKPQGLQIDQTHQSKGMECLSGVDFPKKVRCNYVLDIGDQFKR